MNTGSEKWPDGEVDIRYVGMQSNVQMHTGADVYDLTTTVQPGATYSFSEPMAAPSNAGDYNETWEVAQGARQICQFGVSVIVP